METYIFCKIKSLNLIRLIGPPPPKQKSGALCTNCVGNRPSVTSLYLLYLIREDVHNCLGLRNAIGLQLFRSKSNNYNCTNNNKKQLTSQRKHPHIHTYIYSIQYYN